MNIIDADSLTNISHTYDQKLVELLVYCVYRFEGIAICRESQMDMCWVELADIASYQFPEANKQIIDLL